MKSVVTEDVDMTQTENWDFDTHFLHRTLYTSCMDKIHKALKIN